MNNIIRYNNIVNRNHVLKGIRMSKGYTISFYVDQLKNTTKQFQSANDVYSFISPRKGRNSVKVRQLNTWLGGKTTQVVNSTKLGKNVKQRLITALLIRKNTLTTKF